MVLDARGDFNRQRLAGFFKNLGAEMSGPDFPSEFKAHWAQVPALKNNSRDLCMTLYHIAKNVSACPDPDTRQGVRRYMAREFATWETTAQPSLDRFNAQDLSLTLWACAKLRIQPSAEFMRAWEQAAIQNIDEFAPQNLANALWAMAALGITPSDAFLRAWEQAAWDKIDDFAPQHFANSFWACAVMDVAGGTSKVPADIAYGLYDRIQAYDDFEPRHETQIAHACLWFDWPCDMEGPAESETVSTTERRLVHSFVQAGLPVDFHNGVIPELGDHQIDIPLEHDQDGRAVYIEADGPTHFILPAGIDWKSDGFAEGLRYNGGTLLQTALIHKFAGNAALVRMPFPAIDHLLNMSRDARDRALGNLVSNADHKGPGIYRAQFKKPTRMALLDIPAVSSERDLALA